MSKFILWSPSVKQNTLTFLATPTSIHTIKTGDNIMINTMLRDIGVVDMTPGSWSIQHYLCEYLKEEEATEWEDVWIHTWKIVVTFSKEQKLSIEMANNILIRSSAVDKSARTANSVASMRALWVLNFYDTDYDSVFAAHLQELKEALEEGKSKKEILETLGDPEEEKIYYSLCDNYLSYKKLLKSNTFFSIINHKDKQLWIDLGELEYSFFKGDHPFLKALKDLAKIFNSTYSWNDHIHHQANRH